MQVVHPVAKLATNASGAIWWPNLQPIQEVLLKSISSYFSWEIYSSYGLNTLGPLCLWQCLEVISWCTRVWIGLLWVWVYVVGCLLVGEKGGKQYLGVPAISHKPKAGASSPPQNYGKPLHQRFSSFFYRKLFHQCFSRFLWKTTTSMWKTIPEMCHWPSFLVLATQIWIFKWVILSFQMGDSRLERPEGQCRTKLRVLGHSARNQDL